jgi:hypothetical protein
MKGLRQKINTVSTIVNNIGTFKTADKKSFKKLHAGSKRNVFVACFFSLFKNKYATCYVEVFVGGSLAIAAQLTGVMN